MKEFTGTKDTILYYLSSSSDPTDVKYIGITCKSARHRLSKHISDSKVVTANGIKKTHKNKWEKFNKNKHKHGEFRRQHCNHTRC